MRGYTSGSLDPLQYVAGFDKYRYNRAVLALRCVEVSKSPVFSEERENLQFYDYDVCFETVAILQRNPVYDLPPENDMIYLKSCRLRNEDGSIPFEPGKTYLIRCGYDDYDVVQERLLVPSDSGEGNDIVLEWMRACDIEEDDSESYSPNTEQPTLLHINYRSIRLPEDEYGQEENAPTDYKCSLRTPDASNWREYYYVYDSPNGLPLITEYTGDVRDYLESEEGRVWKEVIIPLCSLNYESASVILTDRLQSMLSFNTGDSYVLEGREFSREEYESGEAVCLISAPYARLNNLSVGDSLKLDLYNPGYIQGFAVIRTYLNSTGGQVIFPYALTEESRIGVQKEYQIIGIYTSPEQALGAHSFHPDTIFIPKASVPDAEQYEDISTPLLNSLILQNGSSDASEAYMAEHNLGGQFLYFDQNFNELKESLTVLTNNAMRLWGISIVIFLLAAALCLYLCIRRMKPAACSMRKLGISAKIVFFEMFEGLFLSELFSLALGTLFSLLLYDAVTKQLLSESIALSPGLLLAYAALMLLLTLAAGGICCKKAAYQKLIQSGKRR